VLPAAWAQDADRMARLQRDAQVPAALNHPHIAAIYGCHRFPPAAKLERSPAPADYCDDVFFVRSQPPATWPPPVPSSRFWSV
jgi:hypothetical protein